MGLPRNPTQYRRTQRVINQLGSARHISRYQVEDEVAHGGMGAVLRAIDIDMRRPVAIKVLIPKENDEDDIRLRRFIEEAHITGQLEHPNIVSVHELGLSGDGRPFFSMKLVNGVSLHQLLADIRRSPDAMEAQWPLNRLLNVFTDVCNGMAYAHSKGIIHRDIKPENIMVGDYGEVLADGLGISQSAVWILQRSASQSGDQRHPGQSDDDLGKIIYEFHQDGDDEITVDGSIIGTPAYMAPEQAAGRIADVDQTSDVYALGALLYAICTLHASPSLEKVRVKLFGERPRERLFPCTSGTVPPHSVNSSYRAKSHGD